MTMHYCAECQRAFTPAEWDDRHTDTDGEDVHAACCVDCPHPDHTQASLFDPPPRWVGQQTRPTKTVRSPRLVETAEAERDEAIAAVDSDPTDEPWKDIVRTWIEGNPVGVQFTADDVWHALENGLSPAHMPHDNRALGPVVRSMATKGLIHNTGTYRPSVRRHMSPIVVWERSAT